MEKLGHFLIEHGYSIASAESFTVGGFASAIGSIPGISKVYRGSIVTYQTEMKHRLLKIDQTQIEAYGVVSPEIALAMAKNGKDMFDADICVSFTGNSGPLPMENKPVGLCYVGIACFDQINVYELDLKGSREDIKNQAIAKAIEMLKQILEIES